MDTCIRMINDEENGILEGWLMLHVPDEASDEELLGVVQGDENFYAACCEFFARHMSRLIAKGGFDSRGRTVELFNVEAFREAHS